MYIQSLHQNLLQQKKKSRKNHKTFSTSSDSDSDTGEVTMRQVTPNPVIAEKNKVKKNLIYPAQIYTHLYRSKP